MMRPIIYLTIILQCSYSILSSVLNCNNETQYEWPMKNPTLCCNKCKPGHYMVWRSEKSCEITCKSCPDNRYMDTHTIKMKCDLCINCNKFNLDLEFERDCSSTQNAKCKCKAGYSLKDNSCVSYVPTTSQQPTPSPPDKEPQTPSAKPAILIKDTVYFLVIIFILCAVMVMFFATKIRPVLHWIRSKHGYFLADSISGTLQMPTCTKEDEVSKPVQEMCGKCDQPIDV